MTIKAFPQRNSYDCAYSTVAMAANVTYRDVYEAAQRFIWRMKTGLTTNEQLYLLQKLTGKVWESYAAPPGLLLTQLQVDVSREHSPNEEDDARFIVSTYKSSAGNIYGRHSLFCNGYRIFDPWTGIWIPFSKLRRMRRYQNVIVEEILTEQGTFMS